MLTQQDLADLVEGAAIFSSGGGGDPQVGLNIVERLLENRCPAQLIDPKEVPDNEVVINFACVGATASSAYRSDAAVKTFKTLEDFLGKKAFAVIPVELGGLNTLAAVDVAARHGIPVVDADGAGRAVPEVHLKVYTLDNIPLAPMVVADLDAENVVLVKQTRDSKAAERISRALATEWNNMAYKVPRVLNGKQVKISPVQNTLSKSIRIGMLLRKAVDPLRAILKETGGLLLFEGNVDRVQRETKGGFTWTTLEIHGTHDCKGSKLELKAKNEFLIANKDDKLTVIGIPAPAKWQTPKGLEMWKEVLQESGVKEKYTPIEKLLT